VNCRCWPECDHKHNGCCVDHDVERFEREGSCYMEDEERSYISPGETLRSNDE
jgi:hypothetical protein